MAISLTTVARVRQRLNLETWESTDADITQFITDSEAIVANYMGALPVAGGTDFALAESIATDLATYYTGRAIPTPRDAAEASARAQVIRDSKSGADRDLAKLLNVPASVPLPRSTTK
ncbi:MAG: hypothetical protein JRF18_01470 [Deltaproteobacteria bacterium]|nr:hypothetical protein [Deltaproteobacteria bacterium]